MPLRPARGIQLARTTPAALLRGAEVLVAAALLFAAWNTIAASRARARIDAGAGPAFVSAAGAERRPGGGPEAAPAPEAAARIAALLEAGAPGAPRLSRALARAVAAAPPGFRITSLEVRPLGAGAVVEAAVAAEVTGERAVAAFLEALPTGADVAGSGVITETRRPERATVVRITFSLAAVGADP